MIKTPLRFPGGKSKYIKIMSPYFPENFKEYREPFIGGGSVFLYLKQIYPERKYWINDLNENLYLFWKILKENPKNMHDYLIKNKVSITSEESITKNFIYHQQIIYNNDKSSEFEKACAYYVVNKNSYSGLEKGTNSISSFYKNYTINCINNLLEVSKLLQNVKITNLDYSELLNNDDEIFLYNDPPYYLKDGSNIYGKDGYLHKIFDHNRFYEEIKKSKNKILISYNECPEILEKYKDFNIEKWEALYCINTGINKKTTLKSEILIKNY